MVSDKDSPSQLYAISRSQIEHDDISIGMRLIWLNNCLAFMFGVYAAVTLFSSPTTYWHAKAQMLSIVLPYVGVLVSLFTLLDIVKAIRRMSNIRKDYELHKNAELSGIPMLDGTYFDRLFQRLSPVAQALFFLLIWLYLLLYDKQVF
ncbi:MULTISPECIES: hypothetical protein [unclassified Mucilaginibacter]|uniref:hypothetical protein n=1 Tax=unclassified Mucilaginibacter TaxID=2617802 RepID=UPI0031F62BC0